MRGLFIIGLVLAAGSAASAGELSDQLRNACTSEVQQKLPVNTAETVCTCVADKMFSQFSVRDIQATSQNTMNVVMKHFFDQCYIRFNYTGK